MVPYWRLLQAVCKRTPPLVFLLPSVQLVIPSVMPMMKTATLHCLLQQQQVLQLSSVMQ